MALSESWSSSCVAQTAGKANDTTSDDAIVGSQINSQPASVRSHRHHNLSDAHKTWWNWQMRSLYEETTTIRGTTHTYDQTIPGQFMPQQQRRQQQQQQQKRRDTRQKRKKKHRSKRGREPEREKRATPQSRHEQHTPTNKTNTNSKPSQDKNRTKQTQNTKRNRYGRTSTR